jgi:oligopeptide transport system permease protein
MIPVLIAISLFTFFLGHLAPGGPFDRDVMQRQLPAETIALLNDRYHLNDPLWKQYFFYMSGLLHGDLGPSFQYKGLGVTDLIFSPSEGRPVWESRIGRTAELGLFAFLFATIFGIPLGVVAALRQNTWLDYASLFSATFFVTIPNFVLSVFLLIIFSVTFGWFPVATTDYTDWHSWVLPSLALGVTLAAFLARLTRATMLEVLRQDYIRTARSKGLSERMVVIKHALRNSMIPTTTVLGPALAGLLTGSFFIEYMFSFPGAGRLYIQSVGQRDYSMMMGTTMMYAFLIALANLSVDMVYSWLDPRIKLS